MSIVERLGGFWCCKDKTFIWIVQGFWKKSVEMEVIFNRCWVFREAGQGTTGQGTGPCPASSFFVTFEIIFLNIPAGQ
ncbi:hypothetical protein CIK98_10670 [Prevotella sp. P2-180]|nr:hypothetical protein CIK98_10670 [Prevotella sp. P2-180]